MAVAPTDGALTGLNPPPLPDAADPLIAAARARIGVTLVYDPAYVSLSFPMGDVPDDRGVCADVVVRAYRALGADLQALVNADMRAHFAAYPQRWGLTRPDANIDHRRVPNLETFFERHGLRLPASDDPSDYLPGDLVTYRIDNRLPHIAIVSDRAGRSGAPLIIHNVGLGTQEEDALFAWPIEARFRWRPTGE